MIKQKSVIELFEEQVAKSKDKIAIVSSNRDYTYYELNCRAKSIAKVLIGKGFLPNSIVGIAVDRSFDLIAAVLGILKAGGCVFPIDMNYPADRIQFMIKDTRPGFIITSKTSREKIPESDAELILVENITEVKDEVLKTAYLKPDDLIYLIYTSGSTGKPKGLKMPHRVISNLIDWQNNISTPGSFSTLQFAPISFDVSFQEIFSTLTSGSTLYLIDENNRKDPFELIKFISQNKIERIFLPFIALQTFAEAAEQSDYKLYLKHIITAGEQLIITPQIERFFRNNKNITLHNQYGPSETHVCTSFILNGPSENWPKFPPIGRAIQNSQILLLDENLNIVNAGSVGEIFIGGTCVAEGYLNRDELTAARFRKIQIDGTEQIFYKTGDLGKLNESGDIEFLGRADEQIKLHGYRIEPGEIENSILEFQGINSAAVVLQELSNGEKVLAAYFSTKGAMIDVNTLKLFLDEKLPLYMVPKYYFQKETLPLTPSGKIDKKVLKSNKIDIFKKDSEHSSDLKIDFIEEMLIKIWREVLGKDSFNIEDNFFDIGGDSISIGRVQIKIKEYLKEDISVVNLYTYPSIFTLREFISAKRNLLRSKPKSLKELIKPTGSDIAIIGIAGRYPKANDIKQFWDNLLNGVEAISFFSDEELEFIPNSNPDSELKFVKARGVLEDADKFDAEFFGFNPREAAIMDPQHRVFLECCYNALEDAGYVPDKFEGSVGIFAGSSLNTYLIYNLLSDRNKQEDLANSYQIADYTTLTGNDNGFLTTKVAYKLGLNGPAVNVQTACSTSLVAVGEAYKSLITGECDMAIAGGVSISFPQKRGYYFVDGSIGSIDGHCKPFDADATGTVFSAGAGVVVLKRLEDAIKDGDSVYAVIKSVALNNDGSDKAGYMTPSIDGQKDVIVRAQKIAGVNSETIKYVETHGTGTPVGDPIEVTALEKAFRISTDKKQFCGIGSVKSNIGHTDAAAGVTGLIKTALVLKHKTIPPTLHFQKPNPRFDFSKSPFYVVDKLTRIESNNGPVRAAVSAFGVGGTNAHAILEEYFDNEVLPEEENKKHILIVSAKTENSLKANITSLANYLADNQKENITDIAFTLQQGRKEFEWRQFVIASSAAECEKKFRDALSSGNNKSKVSLNERNHLVFMFPGQGAQYVNMGRGLYDNEPLFKDTVDQCSEILKPLLNLDLRDLLFPETVNEESAKKLEQTVYTQPALFVIEYSLAKLFISYGIKPNSMIGHSVGDYVAACLADVFTLEDALFILSRRAKLMQQQKSGSMLSVRSNEEQIKNILDDDIAVAAINSPNLIVLSGATEKIKEFSDKLNDLKIENRILFTSHAYHSKMMEPAIEPFIKEFNNIKLNKPSAPFISSLTGSWITDEQAIDPKFWAAQLRNTVRFSDGIKELQKINNLVLIEVGPGRALSTMAGQHKKENGRQTIITTLTQPNEDADDSTNFLTAVGKLWLNGIKIEWQNFHKGKRRRRIHLPGYQFDRKSYWIEPPKRDSLKQKSVLDSSAPVVQSTKKEKVKKVIQGEAMTRKEYITGILKDILEELSGISKSELDESKTFLELGFDSLFMTQVSLAFQKRFDVKITLRQLLETAPSINAIAEFIDGSLAQGKFEPPKQEIVIEEEIEVPVTENIQQNISSSFRQQEAFTQSTFTPLNNVEKLIYEQLEIMKKQLEVLSGGKLNQQLPTNLNSSISANTKVIREEKPLPESTLKPKEEKKVFERFGPYKPIETKKGGALTEKQQKYLNRLIEEYTRKTPTSKKMTQEHRAHYSDPRTVSGFLPIWKEMTYQVIVKESKGSKLIDVDNNEYIDVIMGFGQYLFGHNPDFLKEAIEEQLKLGIEIGPQSPIAGEVAKLICEFTGLDRAAFCVTGSEAVLGAMRAARTVTGKDKIVFFTGDYHGIIDEVLIKTTINGDQIRTMPIAPGIPKENVQNTIALEYGSEESLRIIEKLLPELAAIMVEPVQSRRPDLQPKEFLLKLREIADKANIPLIFDEVITGFRVSNGGAQEYFGVKADIATYGKILGGGFPIGVIAGKKLYMDAFDGGYWQYGDDSIPEAGVTFFAGTFARHPLSLKGALTVLNYLKKDNNRLQQELNSKAASLASELNDFMLKRNVPIKFLNFSSVLYYSYPKDLNYFSLLFYLMRHKGIHILEGFPFFLSSAHSEEDIKKIINAFKESVVELQDNGFFPAQLGGGNGEVKKTESPVFKSNQFPLADAQKEIWLASQISETSNCAFNESNNIEFKGEMNLGAFRKAFDRLIQRHDALRTTFSSDGNYQIVHDQINFKLDLIDLSELNESDKTNELNRLIQNEPRIPFDLVNGPLIRACMVKLNNEYHNLLLTAHHIVCDGWSYDVMVRDLSRLYNEEVEGKKSEDLIPMQMKDYVGYLENFKQTNDYKQQEKFWLEKLSGEISDIELPNDKQRPLIRTFNGGRITGIIDEHLFTKTKALCVSQKVTLFTTMLSLWGILLHKLSNQNDIITGIPAAGQQVVGADDLVGHCTNLLPIRFNLKSETKFSEFLKDVKFLVLDAYENQQVTYVDIISKLKLKRSSNRSPLLSTMFNIDPAIMGLKFTGLGCKMNVNPRAGFQFEIGFNIVSFDDHCEIECDYNTDLFSEEKINSIINYYKNIIQQVTDNNEILIKDIKVLSANELEHLMNLLNGNN
ncbi:Polyketide synthase-like protein [Ignavibacterium album JCM 16511]|uniref:Polyketide synthase-like protein n=1 Tax=Ignavibacterium album (strain DSM 19864 / JCM 16511 / NBRC 101810 / Mat9-16) TaxID=945713 RepID=I0AMI1_IGNAJ|nr:hybrid non-ribosomal peptide synthetase/type I polyketide synthase [Ignavibacterium album]AFH50188.1 Polyketide synthase-like protein [Ignavibacterium album JCM 16511]